MGFYNSMSKKNAAVPEDDEFIDDTAGMEYVEETEETGAYSFSGAGNEGDPYEDDEETEDTFPGDSSFNGTGIVPEEEEDIPVEPVPEETEEEPEEEPAPAPTPVPAARPVGPAKQTTAAVNTIKGNISGDLVLLQSICLIGDVENAAMVEIADSGKVVGNITCKKIRLKGQVKGDILAEEAVLEDGCMVLGRVSCKNVVTNGSIGITGGITFTGIDQKAIASIFEGLEG